jgi:DNA repair exonuclease SbcCD ATPase subunit
MEEYENKCAMISQENYRLNELLRLRDADIIRFKEAEAQLKSKVQEMQGRDESKQWTAELELKSREIAELKKQISKSSEEIAKSKQSSLRLGELEKQNSQYSSDIQSLSSQLQTRSAETEEYRNRVSLLETKISTMNNATQREFSSY